MRLLTTVSLFLFLALSSFSQAKVDSLFKVAIGQFKSAEFIKAAKNCEMAGQLAEYTIGKREAYFYATVAYTQANDFDNAFRCLDIMIGDLGYNDKITLESSADISPLKGDPRWGPTIQKVVSSFSEGPENVKFETSDIDNFWDAYERVSADTANAHQIYKEYYFDKGSIGLQSYYFSKIKSIESFVYVHNIRKKYYASIKENTLRAKEMKSSFQNSFSKLEDLYPQATFPPVYFVIGKLNSAGTVSSEGLLIGMDQACMGPEVNTTELNDWEKIAIGDIEKLPHVVAHELIHFQQTASISSTENDTTLLRGAIIEGMADFIGELISGKVASQNLHEYGKGREQEIWNDFKKDMFLNKSHEWIANSVNVPEGKPADLGYWVGYQICKAYYDQAKDKKMTISDMLNITDFKSFYEKSQIDKLFE